MQISQLDMSALEYETDFILRAFVSTLKINTIDVNTASVEEITFTSLPKENDPDTNKINVYNLNKTNFIPELSKEGHRIAWVKLIFSPSLGLNDYTPSILDSLRKLEDEIINHCPMGYLGFSITHSAYSNDIEIRLAMC